MGIKSATVSGRLENGAHARHAVVVDAAGDDACEIGKVGGHVEREAVAADAFVVDVNADGGDLVQFPAFFDPDAAKAVKEAGGDVECGQGFDQHALDIAHVAANAADAAPVEAGQVEDGVADKLAGAVIGDVPAAIDMVEGDALFLPRLRVEDEILFTAVTAEGIGVRVFQ